MSEENALIRSLNQRISELTTEVADLKSEAKQRRLAKRDAESKVTDLAKQVELLTAERDTWKTKAESTPNELQAKLDEATKKLRTRDHADAFAKTISEAKDDKGRPLALQPTAKIESLWREIGYEVPDADPDAKQITELVGKARTEVPHLFTAAPAGASNPASAGTGTKPALPARPGSGRGDPDNGNGKVYVRKSDLQDPRIALDPARSKERAEAAKAGNLVVLDE